VYHVQVSGKGFSINSGVRLNLFKQEVEDDFVKKWDRGELLVIQGQSFDPHDSKIAIYYAPKVDLTQTKPAVAWLTISQSGQDVTDRFITAPPGSAAEPESASESENVDPRRVAVVHGRDDEAKSWMFGFLRSLDLAPIEWIELIRASGTAAPSNRTLVEHLFQLAQAVVVLFTPDEVTRLHPSLVPESDTGGVGIPRLQPRPNVLLEAGMALATHPDRTVLVEIGPVDVPSDLAGVNTVRMTGAAQPLHDLAERLTTAKCDVKVTGNDWLATETIAGLVARPRTAS
jgi:predicted nucleotide-binding protein